MTDKGFPLQARLQVVHLNGTRSAADKGKVTTGADVGHLQRRLVGTAQDVFTQCFVFVRPRPCTAIAHMTSDDIVPLLFFGCCYSREMHERLEHGKMRVAYMRQSRSPQAA